MSHTKERPESGVRLPGSVRGDQTEPEAEDKAATVTKAQQALGHTSTVGLSKSCFWTSRAQLGFILDAFAFATGSINPDSDTSGLMNNIHQGRIPIEKFAVFAQLREISKLVDSFARSLPLFRGLKRSDQELLLKNNTPLYIQYILARYFRSESGLEQLAWIQEGQISLTSIEDIQSLHRIGLREFNHVAEVIQFRTEENLYDSCSKTVVSLCSFPQQCNGLVASFIIFWCSSTSVRFLREPSRIRCLFQEIAGLVELCKTNFDCEVDFNSGDLVAFIETLEKMRLLFDDSGLWDIS